jgi:glycosyltransferase involved in cell wall biosynthesis
VAGLLAAADILACPSRHEPLGNVVIEGWAHLVPVVAAESQGPGALIADGESGLLVPVGDAGALAGVIRRLAPGTADAAALRQRLAAGGRAAYEAKFTEPAVVAKYLDLFRRVAA